MAGTECSDREITHEPISTAEWGFPLFQTRIEAIYSRHNEEVGYDHKDMSLKLVRNAGMLSQAGRKENPDLPLVHQALTNTFAWLTSYANETDISFQEVLEEKYGLGCPRCHNLPCNLAAGRECVKTDLVFEREMEMPTTISGWQKHLAGIYPNNLINVTHSQALKNVTARVVDEAVELVGSTDPDFQGTQNQVSQFHSEADKTFPWRGEFADVLAWGLATAEILNRIDPVYSFGDSLKEKFEAGCPYCGNPTCSCEKKDTLNDRIRKEKSQSLLLADFAEESSPTT